MENEAIAGQSQPGILHSKEQAKMVLYHLFGVHPLSHFEQAAVNWLHQLPETVFIEFCRLPAQIKKGKIWALGRETSPPLKGKERMQQLATVFGWLLPFLEQCWLLYGREIYEKKPVNWNFYNKPEYRNLMDFITITTLPHIVNLLHSAMVTVTGKEYLDKLTINLKQLENAGAEELEKLYAHPALNLHTELVVTFGHFRCLLEANWLLFGE